MQPEAVYRAGSIRGEIQLVPVRLITVGMLENLPQWAVTQPTVMAYTIWRAMFGNGVLIGMTLIIIAVHPHVIPKDRVRAVAVFCGAVLGTSIQATCVWLAATTAIPRLPATASVFVVCQDQNNYHFPCIARSLPLVLLLLYRRCLFRCKYSLESC